MAYLPFVYTVVRRALDGDPDVDDVVQETMLRALRQLPTLRRPESLRSWLAVIAVRQVGTHLHQRRVVAEEMAAFDDAVGVPAVGCDPEELAVLRAAVSEQRHQVARASRWLDPDDRTLLSLWWLESAGELRRTEVADAMGVSVAHAGVRLQRMRGQLEVARAVAAAMDARPRCGQLADAAQNWDGRPSPPWRKRLARHVRSCARCTRAAVDLVPTERLLHGPALLAAPLSLHAALAVAPVAGALSVASGGTAAGLQAGLAAKLLQAVVVHPLVAAIAAGALVTGATVATVTWPSQNPVRSPIVAVPAPSPVPSEVVPRRVPSAAVPTRAARVPSTVPSPAVAAPTLAPGAHVSLESADGAGTFVTTVESLGVLAAVGPGSAAPARQGATFDVVAGLADPACVSFRAPDGRYLRHASWRLRLNPDEGTALYRGDATFCPRAGATAGSVSLESSNYPSYFLHRRGDELWVDQSNGTTAFRADSAFVVRAPLTG